MKFLGPVSQRSWLTFSFLFSLLVQPTRVYANCSAMLPHLLMDPSPVSGAFTELGLTPSWLSQSLRDWYLAHLDSKVLGYARQVVSSHSGSQNPIRHYAQREFLYAILEHADTLPGGAKLGIMDGVSRLSYRSQRKFLRKLEGFSFEARSGEVRLTEFEVSQLVDELIAQIQPGRRVTTFSARVGRWVATPSPQERARQALIRMTLNHQIRITLERLNAFSPTEAGGRLPLRYAISQWIGYERVAQWFARHPLFVESLRTLGFNAITYQTLGIPFYLPHIRLLHSPKYPQHWIETILRHPDGVDALVPEFLTQFKGRVRTEQSLNFIRSNAYRAVAVDAFLKLGPILLSNPYLIDPRFYLAIIRAAIASQSSENDKETSNPEEIARREFQNFRRAFSLDELVPLDQLPCPWENNFEASARLAHPDYFSEATSEWRRLLRILSAAQNN